MKKSQHLVRLAEKLSNKYGSLNAEDFRSEVDGAIQTAVANASSQKSSGIMPFIRMSQQDGASIRFDVTRNDGWSAPTIIVDNLSVEPNNLLPKYQALPEQVKNYLDKYPELYPTQRSGVRMGYSNYTTRLDYTNQASEPGSGTDIARK